MISFITTKSRACSIWKGCSTARRRCELSAHTAHCPGCRALLHALEHETRMLSNALREQEEAVPERLLAGPVRDRTPWAWVGCFRHGGRRRLLALDSNH